MPNMKTPPTETVTVRDHDWAYTNLQMIFDPPFESASASWPPDILSWRTTLTSALSQFLGISGAAIQLDLLHLDGDEVWVRLPRTEVKRFNAAVSGYVGSYDGRGVGFRSFGTSDFLMGLVSKKAEAGIWAQ